MGQQQILLIILSVILVGIAISVGISMFKSYAEQSNIDAMVLDLNNLGALAFQYRIRPASMIGGDGSYIGFDEFFATLPEGMQDNSNAIYRCRVEDVEENGDYVRIRAQSKQYEDSYMWIVVNNQGKLSFRDVGEEAPDWEE